MTPFLVFRLWFTRSSSAERRSVFAVLAIIALLVAVAVRPTTDGTEQVSAGGPATSFSTDDSPAPSVDGGGDPTTAGTDVGGETPSAADSTGPATDSQDAAGTPQGEVSADGDGNASGGGGGGGGAQPASGGGCGPVGENVSGVSGDEILLGVALFDLAGPIGNSAAGIPTPEVQRRMAQAAADELNRKGGVRCRQLKIKTYLVNPLNQNQQQAACLEMAQDRVYAVLDPGAFSYPPTAKDCFPRQKIPYVGGFGPIPSEQQFADFLFSVDAPVDQMIRTSIPAMASRGFFDRAKGFSKLGLFIDDCAGGEVKTLVYQTLGEVGVDKGTVSEFSFNCPGSGFAPPNQVSQAVIQHKLDGVTHVIPVTGSGSFSNYTRTARAQDFKPTYTTIDLFGLPKTSESGGTGPDAQNFDGTVMATLTRDGALKSGLPPSPGDQRCNAAMKAAGMEPTSIDNPSPGGMCNLFFLFAELANTTPVLTQATLGGGSETIGHIDFAYPSADAEFDRPGKHTGGDYYRFIQWQANCYCWKVVEPNFHRAQPPNFGRAR